MLFSGDGDLRRLVEAVQRRGVRVTVISTIRTQPAMIADELRRQADDFIDLAELADHITRRQVEPRPRSPMAPERAPAPRSAPRRPSPSARRWNCRSEVGGASLAPRPGSARTAGGRTPGRVDLP